MNMVIPAVLTMAVSEEAPDLLYLGTEGQGVHWSPDRGTTWHSAGLRGKTIFSLAVEDGQPTWIWAGTSANEGGLFFSSDGGENWGLKNSGLEGRHVYALSPADPETIFAGTDSGIYRSINRGHLWTPIGLQALRVVSLLVHPDFPQIILAGTTDGAYISIDGGAVWQAKNDGLVNSLVQSIAFDTIHARTYLGSAGSGGYRWNTDFR